jgi:hypothetical protein
MNKRTICCASITGLITLSALWLRLWAGSVIEVDSTKVNFGIFTEGDKKQLIHTFVVKNRGSTPLIIHAIKSDAGCITTSYDSIIAGGKNGTIVQTLLMQDILGDFKKTITVISNAINKSQMELTMYGKVEPIIGCSKSFVELGTLNDKRKPAVLTLKTKKTDFVVSGIEFWPNKSVSTATTLVGPVPVRFEFQSFAVKDSSGFTTSEVRMFYDKSLTSDVFGTFVLATNHPDRPVLNMGAYILKPPKSKGWNPFLKK